MKRFTLGLVLCLAASIGMAATVPATQISGEYIEARSADVYTGPCFANSEVDYAGQLAVLGWKIKQGSFEGVSLDGLGVVGVVKATHTLGDFNKSSNPAKAILIVDQRANAEQRAALRKFAQRMSKGLLADVIRVETAPIEFTTANIHSRKAKLTAGTLAAIETRALTEGDQICHNESTWYDPLGVVDHAMAAYSLAHSYKGKGFDTTWSYPGQRSAFVGTFKLEN